ncbi:MAG: baseplate J/gp47 family protein [Patescibacteria group bacterium]|nr:baseplate J/gp47 family protein [Patescibacteria group bacterium]
MEKILLDKKIKINDVIEKIENRPESNLTLIIPKKSDFKKEDFALLKKACEKLNKIITIESVDEEILKLAKSEGLGAVHPLFNANSGLLTDIKKPNIEENLVEYNFLKNNNKKEIKKIKESESELKSNNDLHFFKNINSGQIFKKDDLELDVKLDDPKKYHKVHKKHFILNFKFLIYGILIIGLGLGFWKLSFVFSSAEINLSFKKTPFEFNNLIIGNKNASQLNLSEKIIPVELFKNKQNITLFFKANGKKNISQKATGQITIYNNFSSGEQFLIANTRFQSPNGLIYRLASNVVIPGAQIKDGKIIPSSITATVVADEPGEKYNTGPISKLIIPGFKDSPKYDGFYGELKQGASGGFVGEKVFPLDSDIEKAKKEISEKLKLALENSITFKKPDNFDFVGNFQTDILKIIVVSTSTDDAGNFAVLAEGETKIFAIRRTDLINFLIGFYNQSNYKKIDNFKFEYLNARPDFNNGIVNFNLKSSGNFVYNLNLNDFKNNIAGKKIKEVESIIKNLDELESAKILIKPKWVNVLPANVSKINIILK